MGCLRCTIKQELPRGKCKNPRSNVVFINNHVEDFDMP